VGFVEGAPVELPVPLVLVPEPEVDPELEEELEAPEVAPDVGALLVAGVPAEETVVFVVESPSDLL
jgi:hypothetical protein